MPNATGLPTIAVLPYFCVQQGKISRAFGEELAFSVASALMTLSGIRVISASSTLRYAATAQSLGHVGRELGAQYVLTGQIVQIEQVLSFTQRAFAVDSGRELSIGRIEAHISHLHELSRRVVSRVVAAILPAMHEETIQQALAKLPSQLTAYEALLKAVASIHRLTPASHAEAESLLKKAQSLDPHYGAAHAWHARLLSIRIGQGWSTDPRATASTALGLADRAIALDPRNGLALATAGHLRSYLLHDLDGGNALLDQAIEACPNEPLAWLLSGASQAYIGNGMEGRRRSEYALQLSPFDRYASVFHSFVAVCCYASGDYEDALHHAELSRQENPNYSSNWRVLAATLVALGRIAEARAAGAELLRLQPTYPRIAKHSVPFRDPMKRQLFLNQMLTAGVLTLEDRHHAPTRRDVPVDGQALECGDSHGLPSSRLIGPLRDPSSSVRDEIERLNERSWLRRPNVSN